MNLADLLLVKVLNDEKHLYICWHIVWWITRVTKRSTSCDLLPPWSCLPPESINADGFRIGLCVFTTNQWEYVHLRVGHLAMPSLLGLNESWCNELWIIAVEEYSTCIRLPVIGG
jgi:hypothetical protein